MAEVLNFYKVGKIIPAGAVYIGRAMPHLGLQGSKFANPYKLSEEEERGATIARYKTWLWKEIKSGRISLEDLLELEGKDLVCFCKQPNKEIPCHGDVVLAAVAWARKRYDVIHGYWSWEEE